MSVSSNKREDGNDNIQEVDVKLGKLEENGQWQLSKFEGIAGGNVSRSGNRERCRSLWHGKYR